MLKIFSLVILMYNLIKYYDNYSKTSGSLWQYYKDEANDNLADSESFKSRIKIIGNIRKMVIIAPLKYLSNFWRTLKIS